jgi:hypothetical protein
MTKSSGAVHAFRLLHNSTTKATDHELQKYDNFTRYGHGGHLATDEGIEQAVLRSKVSLHRTFPTPAFR